MNYRETHGTLDTRPRTMTKQNTQNRKLNGRKTRTPTKYLGEHLWCQQLTIAQRAVYSNLT